MRSLIRPRPDRPLASSPVRRCVARWRGQGRPCAQMRRRILIAKAYLASAGGPGRYRRTRGVASRQGPDCHCDSRGGHQTPEVYAAARVRHNRRRSCGRAARIYPGGHGRHGTVATLRFQRVEESVEIAASGSWAQVGECLAVRSAEDQAGAARGCQADRPGARRYARQPSPSFFLAR